MLNSARRFLVVVVLLLLSGCSSGPRIRCLDTWCEHYVSAGYICGPNPAYPGEANICEPYSAELEGRYSLGGYGYPEGYVDPQIETPGSDVNVYVQPAW